AGAGDSQWLRQPRPAVRGQASVVVAGDGAVAGAGRVGAGLGFVAGAGAVVARRAAGGAVWGQLVVVDVAGGAAAGGGLVIALIAFGLRPFWCARRTLQVGVGYRLSSGSPVRAARAWLSR